MDFKRTSVLAMAAIALSMPASGLALAQTESAPAAPPAEMQQPQQDFSDDTLRSFAVAFLQVDQINQSYTPRLQEAATPEEQQTIQQEASQDMVEAVESSEGITVQEYTSILQAAQASPELAEKLTDYIGEASQAAPAR